MLLCRPQNGSRKNAAGKCCVEVLQPRYRRHGCLMQYQGAVQSPCKCLRLTWMSAARCLSSRAYEKYRSKKHHFNGQGTLYQPKCSIVDVIPFIFSQSGGPIVFKNKDHWSVFFRISSCPWPVAASLSSLQKRPLPFWQILSQGATGKDQGSPLFL